VHNLSMSLDGYVAGPSQSLEHPLGHGGEQLHRWAFATSSMNRIHGGQGGDTGLDDSFVARGDEGIGATIMGRNMFGPIRGGWPNEDWRGWWGDNPPYHHPVFVLTHHPRPSIQMEGGTSFHFVTGGIDAALKQAMEAAEGADVRVGGGASTVHQFVRAGLVDELHVVVVPVLLGRGARLFEHLDAATHGLECVEVVSAGSVAQGRLARSS
jgi:dihydrofolate reductase